MTSGHVVPSYLYPPTVFPGWQQARTSVEIIQILARSAKSLGLEPSAVEPRFFKDPSLGNGKRHTQKSYPAELPQAQRFYSSSTSAMSGSPKLSLRRRACSSDNPIKTIKSA
ncbi:hypothetical protein HETIRDRAFT_419046 [Heterobasidion irregulare TC 32-1]|uniref:Uncharacterized protein n=1 Tax=Heterobasidion irregulare (strain TC 32-1) TaxID=747525 RepID=W4K7S8_HETIT|nr:uncharacterized protein HETIRDRAFT_419046 [Heterobasidion irregulare TC 32-1]ETW81131.1 hypothetical protein HETIRDRAFT_419046 [Heterobasidion irregulare TC 32-1]